MPCRRLRAADKSGEHLIAPFIFNLRHGLELLLKFLALSTGETMGIAHHNTSALFGRLKSVLTTIDNETLEFAADGLGVEKNLVSRHLHIMSEKVEAITDKYYSYGFLFADPARSINDPNNELFRYPANTVAGGAFDVAAYEGKVSAADVVRDIELLSNFSWSIYVSFGRHHTGVHLLKGLESGHVAE